MKLNNSGFSLLEVIISSALIATSFVALGTYYVHVNKMRAEYKMKMDLSIAVNKIRERFDSKISCDNLVGNQQSFNSQASQDPFKNDGTFNKNGGMNLSLSMGSNQLVHNSSFGDNRIHVDFIKLYRATAYVNLASSTVYSAEAYGGFSIGHSTVATEPTEPQFLGSALFEVDNGTQKILGCFDPNSDIDDVLLTQCQKMGGTLNPSTNQCDLASNICQRLGGTYSNGTCSLPPIPRQPAGGSGGDVCTLKDGREIIPGSYANVASVSPIGRPGNCRATCYGLEKSKIGWMANPAHKVFNLSPICPPPGW